MAKLERSTGIVALTAFAAAFALTGCSGFAGDDDDVVYCVDQNDNVVSQQEYEKYCDDTSPHYVGGGGYYFMHGPYASGITPGTHLDRSASYGRFSTSDANARSSAGLPPSGKVTVGQPIPGKSGGFGISGGGGSKGGFGGGGSSSGG